MRSVIFLILISLLVFSSKLTAADSYINVTKTLNQSQLWEVKSKLQDIGYDTIFTQTKIGYLIFSGPYEDDIVAESALKKIKRYFPSAFITSEEDKKIFFDSIPSADTNTSVEKKIQEHYNEKIRGATIYTEPLKSPYKDSFFIGASTSYASVISNGIPLTGSININLPSTQGYGYGMNFGYSFENGLFVSLDYLNVSTYNIRQEKALNFKNTFVSVNYKFTIFGHTSPFVGMLAGNTVLNWTAVPIDNAIDFEMKSKSSFTGYQIGLIATQFDPISAYVVYQYMFMNHTANLENISGKSELQLNRLRNLQAGIQINF